MSYPTEIIEIPIDQIKIGQRHQGLNEDIVDVLKTSIKEIGLKNPITITRNGVLVSGLHRLTALAKLGYKKAPCIYTDVDAHKNYIEQIDENLIRQSLTFPEKAQQTIRKVQLMIKALKNLDSIESEEMNVYLDDYRTYQPLIGKLRVRNQDYLQYKQVILNLDPVVFEFLKQIHMKRNVRNVTYVTLSKLPKEWQYRFINESNKKSPNVVAANLDIEYNRYLIDLRIAEIRQRELGEAHKREEERIQKLEENLRET